MSRQLPKAGSIQLIFSEALGILKIEFEYY